MDGTENGNNECTAAAESFGGASPITSVNVTEMLDEALAACDDSIRDAVMYYSRSAEDAVGQQRGIEASK